MGCKDAPTHRISYDLQSNVSEIVIKMWAHAKHLARKRKLVRRAAALLILDHLLQTAMEFSRIQTEFLILLQFQWGISCSSRTQFLNLLQFQWGVSCSSRTEFLNLLQFQWGISCSSRTEFLILLQFQWGVSRSSRTPPSQVPPPITLGGQASRFEPEILEQAHLRHGYEQRPRAWTIAQGKISWARTTGTNKGERRGCEGRRGVSTRGRRGRRGRCGRRNPWR
jgi:hypothetical protein